MKLDLDRYHILDNGYGTPIPNGKWLRYEDVEQLFNDNILLNSDQQKTLLELGLELIKLDGKHKNFDNANAIDLIVNILNGD